MNAILHYLRDMLPTLAALTAATSALAVHPRSRRLGYVLWRYGKRHAPRWAIVLMLAPIPGPVDELAALAGILWSVRAPAQRQILKRYLARV